MKSQRGLRWWVGWVLLLLVVFVIQPAATWADELDRGDRSSAFQPTPRFEVVRIRSDLLPGVVVGGHYEGILNILQHHYTASSSLDERLEEGLRRVVEDELRHSGYAIASSVNHSVFEDHLIQAAEPGRFLVGGSIVGTQLNSYSSWLGNHTHEQRTVRWEVLDRDSRSVIYQQETRGDADVPGIDNPAATYEAIRASFQEFLTQSEFGRTIEQAAVTVPDLATVTYAIQAIASANSPFSVEHIAGNTIPSVVAVRTPSGRGSGFLIDASGLVVTNQHVVESNSFVKLDLYDGSTRSGRVLKRDAAFDVALIKMEGESNIPVLPVCHTNSIKVGEGVVAIGNPLRYSNTVTQGIVSSIREIGARTLIQTDAAINPGNSGGPLLNREGTVIGIVTEKVFSRGIEGLGFALPIGDALQKLNVVVQASSHSPLNSCGNPL